MRILLLVIFLCLYVVGWGQDFKSGTVNSKDFINQYYKVTTVDRNRPHVTVAEPRDLAITDRVMIIQMTGAEYNNNGTVSRYNSAGNYEIASICAVEGNTISFTHDLIHTYEPDKGKVQLVKLQKYTNAVVSSTLEATPWDSLRGTGGILAISVDNTLTLNANISANGKGFKGGEFRRSTADCTDFLFVASGNYYDPTRTWALQSGAYKGESIVNLEMDSRGGKGAVANGGGGGNNHNNGGGGGSNITLGGKGGGNSSTEGCQTPNPGQGGYALTNITSNGNGNRIFLGGGGGAGHGNYEFYTGPMSGGNGGGILFIEAGAIVGLGKISANGNNGSNAIGDGASGGGGGGTVILSIYSPSAVTVEALGGRGGNEDESQNDKNRCYGEGGGGSGGAVYIKGSQQGVTVSVTGGAKGIRSPILCPLQNEAVSGIEGKVFPIANYAQSTNLSDDCPDPIGLPVTLLSFTVSHKGSQAIAQWEVGSPEDADYYILQRRSGNESWKDAHTIPGEAQLTTYQKGDGPLATGIYLYRLKIVEKDRSVHYSSVQQVTIKAEDINRLTIYPNPATSEITIVAPGAQDGWLQIYDMKSRLVLRRKITPNETLIRQDISFLSEGIYMIQVGKLTARFVVFK